MRHSIRTLLMALLIGVPATAHAGSDDVTVENAWARAAIGTSRPGAAYMDISNTGDEAVTLTGIETDIAMMPMIHRSATDAKGISSMSAAGDIVIAPGETVMLEPGGYHAMLMKLRHPMKEGESFPLILLFSDGGIVVVEVPILGIAARGPEG